jgi:hypothetical protein
MKHALKVYAFTEQGIAMLSRVLNSPCAIRVNISIMRTFMVLREFLYAHEKLARLGDMFLSKQMSGEVRMKL